MFTVYVYSYNEAVPGVSIITVGSFNMIIVTTAFYVYCDQFNSFNSVTIYLVSLLSDISAD